MFHNLLQGISKMFFFWKFVRQLPGLPATLYCPFFVADMYQNIYHKYLTQLQVCAGVGCILASC
jgi:hypothetical protein